MNGPISAELRQRIQAAELQQSGQVEAAAVETLEKLLTRINDLAGRAQLTLAAFPSLQVNPLWLRSIRSNAGMALADLENSPGVRWGRRHEN